MQTTDRRENAALLLPLTLPEVRRLLLARTASADRQQLCLHWSHFRRTHQAVAKRGHNTLRARRVLSSTPAHLLQAEQAEQAEQFEPTPTYVVRLAGTRPLTEGLWQQVASLLPPLQVAPKRPCYDHQTCLNGMLWVMQTGHAWRDVPSSFGPWHVVYDRYRTWRTRGLWEAILTVLHPEGATLPFLL